MKVPTQNNNLGLKHIGKWKGTFTPSTFMVGPLAEMQCYGNIQIFVHFKRFEFFEKYEGPKNN